MRRNAGKMIGACGREKNNLRRILQTELNRLRTHFPSCWENGCERVATVPPCGKNDMASGRRGLGRTTNGSFATSLTVLQSSGSSAVTNWPSLAITGRACMRRWRPLNALAAFLSRPIRIRWRVRSNTWWSTRRQISLSLRIRSRSTRRSRFGKSAHSFRPLFMLILKAFATMTLNWF